MKIISSPEFENKLKAYPDHVKDKMLTLRQLVIDTARETGSIDKLEETLKWGEPAYVTRHGSTLRMDWKEKSPDHYAMYFQCTSRLVDTFKAVFGNTFNYEGNRALVFALDQDIPVEPLKACIRATLNYHKVKGMVMLGI